MDYTYINIDSNFDKSNDIREFIQQNLKKYGMSLSFSCDIAFSYDDIKNVLGVCPNNLIIVKLSDNFDKNINFKNFLCECFNSFLVKNNACSFAIESYLRLYEGELKDPKNFENESLIPDGAEPLTSDFGFVQGYMLNYKNINFIFLPPDKKQIEDIINNKLASIFFRLYKTPTEFMYLKIFGLQSEMLSKILLPFINNSIGISVNWVETNLDALISIGYNKSIDSNELDSFVAKLCESVKKYLYAIEDVSIEKMTLDLISMTKKQFSLIESFTKGKLYYNLASIDNTCIKRNLAYHKIVSDISDITDLQSINRDIIGQKGFYSVDSCYEITTAIINELKLDLAISSMGEYDENSSTLHCFLSIGDIDGVHIYKSTYKGCVKDLQDLVCKNTCFYIIRKLKQNNLYFDQTI